MKVIRQFDLFSLACKAAKKFGVYISFPAPDMANCRTAKVKKEINEIFKAAPYLKVLGEQDPGHLIQILCDGQAVFHFDDIKEQQKIYGQTVGDDGPTKSNPYKGPVRVFALTCDNKGKLMSENT